MLSPKTQRLLRLSFRVASSHIHKTTHINTPDLPIYLDAQATTPVDPRVLEAMMPYFTRDFGNPHSKTHIYGTISNNAMESAREQIASLIGALPKEIIFTSGATESNNTILKGIANFYRTDKKNHIITTQIEHKCVLDSCRYLERQGFKITYLNVQRNGLVDLDELRSAINDSTILVSIMGVNNEIGVAQPLQEIGEICRSKGVFFHSDCAQMIGKLPIDVNKLNLDLISVSSHKIYGPKGIGVLYIRSKPRVRIEPLMNGGGQERGMRSGTMPTPLIVGLGKACELCRNEMATDTERITKLSKKLYNSLNENLDKIYLNGDSVQRYWGCLNISFSCVEGESLLLACKELAMSSGSACTSATLEPSYVLRAIGISDDLAHTSLRIGLSRFTTDDEINTAIDVITNNVKKLRDMSPLWEMAQEGIDMSKIKWNPK